MIQPFPTSELKTFVPPLQSGDCLTRDEFEVRYAAMPENVRAELIEGVVYVASAVRLGHHGEPTSDLLTWLGAYKASTPGVRTATGATIRLDLDNEPQPDALLMIDPKHGGQAQIDDEDYVVGAPELVAEVSASTVSIDLHAKFRVYRRNRVREYVVWRVQDGEIDWFTLHGSDYQRRTPDESGVLRSEVFPGLWLDVAGLVQMNLAGVLEAVRRGTATPEHGCISAFVTCQPAWARVGRRV